MSGHKTQIYYVKQFDDVYVKYLHKIAYYAKSFVLNEEDAMSVAHDTFMVLWEQREDLDFTKDVFPFLLVTAKNRCLNILRSQKAKYRYESYLKYREVQFNIDAIMSPFSTKIMSKEVTVLVDKALVSMDTMVRETYLLSRRQGLKNKEIAQAQQISISTVEFRLSRAYRILRKLLEDYVPILLLLIC